MSAAELMSQAKVRLILNQPFFATLALGLKYAEDPSIKTMCTNGQRIRYNPAFVEGLPVDQIAAVIAHEVMHVAGLHHTRQQGRNAKKWNCSTDYVINDILTKSGFSLPSGALISPQYQNMSAEEVYSLLPDMPDDGNGSGDQDGDGPPDPGGMGAVEPGPGQSKAEQQQQEAEVRQLVAQAATVAKMQGKLPAHLARLVEQTMTPVIDWRAVLAAYLTERARHDYTWTRPNRRYQTMGLYLPSLDSQAERAKFSVIIDTSGSCDEVTLRDFMAEVQSIAHEVAASVVVLHVDTEVNSAEEYEAEDVIPCTMHGGGGTDFRPGFDWLAKEGHEPAAIIYLTDGLCNSYPAAPNAPTIWAQVGNYEFAPPFGEVLKIKD